MFFLLTPVLVKAWLGRGFTWQEAFASTPDMLVWMSIVVVADLILAIYKTIYLLRQGRVSPVPEVSEPQAASAV